MVLTQAQRNRIGKYIAENGRDIEQATWAFASKDVDKEVIVTELLKYQNPDGGFGHGLEADIQMPGSSSIASTEAIFIAYEYELDCHAKWFKRLLDYFENTINFDVLSFWEKVPKEVENYPHAPWWNYHKEDRFSPNPCAVVASAFLTYGSDSQKILGNTIARRCVEFLSGEDMCSEHDCYCLQVLFKTLMDLGHELAGESLSQHMERRILECVCTDSSRWTEYVAQPLDLVKSPDSRWYHLLKPYIEANIEYWLNTLNEEGYWKPNFSWGSDTELAKQVTVYWQCHIAVKRVKILHAFQTYKPPRNE